ncbi:MAG: 30S ribosomal protein S3ae [Candidatus Aenigmatarchaeota archaeon]
MAKVKGKEWYQIVAPKMFGNKVLGETFALDPDAIPSRVMAATLLDLTGEPSKYYFKLFFRITDLKGGKANTTFVGHECTRDYIARVVSIRTNRIDTNNVFHLKDARIRVKTIAITTRHVRASVATDIRKKIGELLSERLSKMSLEDFVKEMVAGKIQSYVRFEVNKVYPLRAFEINKTGVF